MYSSYELNLQSGEEKENPPWGNGPRRRALETVSFAAKFAFCCFGGGVRSCDRDVLVEWVAGGSYCH